MSATETKPVTHGIQWTGEDSATFTCDAAPGTACKFYPACDCEYWDENHDKNHPPIEQSECWKVAWLSAGVPSDTYCEWNPVLPHHDGPIVPDWQGDYMLWDYAKEGSSDE